MDGRSKVPELERAMRVVCVQSLEQISPSRSQPLIKTSRNAPGRAHLVNALARARIAMSGYQSVCVLHPKPRSASCTDEVIHRHSLNWVRRQRDAKRMTRSSK